VLLLGAGSVALAAFLAGATMGPPADAEAAAGPVASDTDVAVAPRREAASGEPAGPPRPSAADSIGPTGSPAPLPGRLVITSQPAGALVMVDGRLEGSTPVDVGGLPFGVHEVRVSRPGHVPRVERVDLTASRPSETLTFELVRGLDPAAPSARGALFVDSRPRGAVVTLDGRRVGLTPLRVPAVDAGRRLVGLAREGYRPVRAEVDVRPGEQGRVAVTLEPGRAPRPVR
jgi:hypothetical protein